MGLFPGGDGEESTCNAGDPASIPGSGRSPGEENGYTLQYSCLGNPWTEEPGRLHTVHGAAESETTEQLTLSLQASRYRPSASPLLPPNRISQIYLFTLHIPTANTRVQVANIWYLKSLLFNFQISTSHSSGAHRTIFFFFFFFLNPYTLQWEHGVLTTGPPRKSLSHLFNMQIKGPLLKASNGFPPP